MKPLSALTLFLLACTIYSHAQNVEGEPSKKELIDQATNHLRNLSDAAPSFLQRFKKAIVSAQGKTLDTISLETLKKQRVTLQRLNAFLCDTFLLDAAKCKGLTSSWHPVVQQHLSELEHFLFVKEDSGIRATRYWEQSKGTSKRFIHFDKNSRPTRVMAWGRNAGENDFTLFGITDYEYLKDTLRKTMIIYRDRYSGDPKTISMIMQLHFSPDARILASATKFFDKKGILEGEQSTIYGYDQSGRLLFIQANSGKEHYRTEAVYKGRSVRITATRNGQVYSDYLFLLL